MSLSYVCTGEVNIVIRSWQFNYFRQPLINYLHVSGYGLCGVGIMYSVLYETSGPCFSSSCQDLDCKVTAL